MNRVVVKVGSSSLHDGVGPRTEIFSGLADQVAKLQDRSEVVLVSSGAIAFGRTALSETLYREDGLLEEEQMMAAIGQPLLMKEWRKAFGPHIDHIGQVLLTNQELFGKGTDEREHAKGVLEKMLDRFVLPIVNENDTVAVDEIVQGDNDKLSAHVGHMLGASELFLLGRADGFYTDFRTPSEFRVPFVYAEEISSFTPHAEGTEDPRGTGGMKTKLEAAEIFLGVPGRRMYIASAFEPNVIDRVRGGEIGTIFES